MPRLPAPALCVCAAIVVVQLGAAVQLGAVPEDRGAEVAIAAWEDAATSSWAGAEPLSNERLAAESNLSDSGAVAGDHGLPRLVMIGAQKGGTTFLRSALHTHPSLGTCCHPYRKGDTIECGMLQWIPKTLPAKQFRWKYAQGMLKHSCGGPVLFDDRPDYLASLEDSTIQLAANILPRETLFVVTMRDPVARMQSAMAMDSCMHGTAQNDCLLSEHIDVLQNLPVEAQAVSYGLYARHLKRWLSYLPRERVQMLFFEEVTRDPLTALNQVVTRMGLDSFSQMPENVRTKPVQEAACRRERCDGPVKAELRSRFQQPAQCSALSRLYGPENEELARLSGSEIPLGWSKCAS